MVVVLFTLLLGALLSAPAAARSECSFTQQQPRFYQGSTRITALNVNAEASPFLNDALLRTLKRQMGLSECQVQLTQGQECEAALVAAPCPDPLWVCGGDSVLSNSVYQTALSGLCNDTSRSASTQQACQTLEDNPSAATAVADGDCEASCYLGELDGSSNSTAVAAAPTPESTAAGSSCYAYTLQVDSPTDKAAEKAAANLHNATTMGALLDALASFSATSTNRITFLLGDTAVSPVVGFGYFPPPSPPPSPPPPSPSPPPSPPPPLTAFEPASSNSPGNSPDGFGIQSVDDSAELQYGSWGACSADCGTGWQLRTASCLSPSSGALLALEQCAGSAGAVVSRACTGPNCQAPHWLYSPWSACNATCGGGSATRTATCDAPAGFQCSTASRLPTEQECNTAPCQAYAWLPGAWAACSATCGGGTQARPVSCIDQSGRQVAAPNCFGSQPAKEQACNLQACDFCAANACFGSGTCSNGACTCSPDLNVTGSYCQVPADCNSGAVDAEMECCDSGLVDSSGTCCDAGSVLDSSAACCSAGILDACGVCGGNATSVDVFSACCATLQDANGVCCESGEVDECGVCDGMGNSCAVTLQLQIEANPSLVYGDSIEAGPLDSFLANLTEALQLPPGALSLESLQEAAPVDEESLAIASQAGTRRLLLAEKQVAAGKNTTAVTVGSKGDNVLTLTASITLEPAEAAEEGAEGPFSAAWMAAVLAAVAAEQPAAADVQLGAVQTGRVGVCGNGICEVGERTVQGSVNGSCPQDCGFETRTCPSGCSTAGICQPSSGTCQCFAGRSGTACESCAAGYYLAGETCVADVVQLGLVSPAPATGVPTAGSGAVPSGPEVDTASSEGQGSGGVNVGAIVGPIIAVLAVGVAAAAFVVHRRRRRAFLAFAAERTPSASGGPSASGYGDVESQSGGSENGNAATNQRQQPRHSAAPHGSTSSMGGGSAWGTAPNGVRGSHDSLLRGSQEQFKTYTNGMVSSYVLCQSLGSQYQQQGSGGSNPLRTSLSASTGAAPPFQPMGALAAGMASLTPMPADSHLRACLGSMDIQGASSGPASQPVTQSSSQTSGSSGDGRAAAAAPTVAALVSSQLTADSPLPPDTGAASQAATAATSMVVHPMLSPDPSMSLLSLHSTKRGVITPSFTASPLDPQARLFNNPAYNAQDVVRMSESKSVMSASHVPRLPYGTTTQPLSERQAALAADADHEAGSLNPERRRDKLDKLRAAVEALEAGALQTAGQIGAKHRRPAAPGELESPSGAHQPMNLRGSVESVCWAGPEDNASSPLALSSGQRSYFLDGRPVVPRLQLGKLQTSGDLTATVAAAAAAEQDQAPTPSPEHVSPVKALTAALPLARPLVPVLALSKLNPAASSSWRSAAPPARIPAANFSALDASLHRSPSKLAYSSSAASSLPSRPSGPHSLPGGEPAPDPLDDLDAMLDPVRLPNAAPAAPATSARQAIAAGFSRLLAPLRSSRRQGSEPDWERQLSSRGMGTPRSWAEDSGMQRTRASSSLQRSLELEGGAAPPAPSPLGTASGTTPTTSTTSASAGGASRYFNTPRGRLLQTLASEAAAAQKERSLAGAREGLPPSYSQVLGVIDAALQGAGPSPSKIPRQPSARAGSSVASEESAEAAAQMPVYRSPSKIPRPARLGLPQAPVTDENAFSLPSSPDKEQPTAAGAAARFGRALSSSIENLQLNRY